MIEKVDWGERAHTGFLASGIDPADRRGHKNKYIDLLQKMALEEVLKLKGDEVVLDFGCGSGRMSYWIAPKVKEVIGLDVTPDMIQLAEKNRKADNVEFLLYDGIHFPVLPLFDLVLSVWVLQYTEAESLKKTVLNLTQSLKPGGRVCLIEQVSDNPRMKRPELKEYLRAFEELGLDCLQCHSIRKGRWWLLYLIRYGLIPERWFPRIASLELKKWRRVKGPISYYIDYLFLAKKA